MRGAPVATRGTPSLLLLLFLLPAVLLSTEPKDASVSIRGGQASIRFAQLNGDAVVLKRFTHSHDYANEIAIIQLLAQSPYILSPLATNVAQREIVYRRARDGDLYTFAGLERLEYEQLVLIARQMVLAVGGVHGAGHLHLDVKPENFVREGTRIWLIDFGLAARIEAAPRGVGTPRTMAPEALLSMAHWMPMTTAADWWSIGATIFYIFARYFDLPKDMHFGHFPYRVLYRERDGEAAALDWPPRFPDRLPASLLDLLFSRRGLLSPHAGDRLLSSREILSHPFFHRPKDKYII